MITLLLTIVFLCVITTCGFFWAYGGDKGGAWRGLGCAITLGYLFALFTAPDLRLQGIGALSAVLLYCATTIGYGIPCSYSGDKGSPVGRFWYWVAKILGYSTALSKEKFSNHFTRATVGLAYGGALSLLPFSRGHVIIGVLVILLAMINTVYWGAVAGDLPPIYIRKLKLNATEFNIGMGVGLCGCLALL